MSTMIQIRNVPETLHRTLKARAATMGMSLTDYLLMELREIALRPTLQELRERVQTKNSVTSEIDSVRMLQEERD